MDKLMQISFVTITYNGLEDTCQLIDSIITNVKSVSYEIIVVDNASKINESEIIKSKYPSVTTIRSEQNKGFSGGNNLGIKEASGKFIFIINNDTYFKEDGLIHLLERLNSNPNIAAVSPKIKFGIPPYLLQFAGYTKLSSITLRNSTIGQSEIDNGQYDNANQMPYLHGAALLIKKSVIEEVGFMPEIYFLYYEELDWCVHISKAGYELWYEPKCTVFHKESQSTGQESPLKVFYLTRNRLIFAWRNLSKTDRILSIFYQILIANFKNLIIYTCKNRSDLSKATIKGINSFFFYLAN